MKAVFGQNWTKNKGKVSYLAPDSRFLIRKKISGHLDGVSWANKQKMIILINLAEFRKIPRLSKLKQKLVVAQRDMLLNKSFCFNCFFVFFQNDHFGVFVTKIFLLNKRSFFS